MFVLSKDEFGSWRSQFVTSNADRKRTSLSANGIHIGSYNRQVVSASCNRDLVVVFEPARRIECVAFSNEP
jgi:hypothetical protein